MGNQEHGEIHIIIGPNGYGKTTYLETEKKRLEANGASVLYLPSEIKLLDEIKDTTDNTQAMEFLLTEIIETQDYIEKREALYEEADKAIAANNEFLNAMVDEVLEINGTARGKDFIAPNNKRVIKNIIAINQEDAKKKMGSGQRMQLLLRLATRSSKEYIFLDEPEKYSHPSMLNGTAKAIMQLLESGKTLYIATHSPKLISMLDIDLTSIKVINDSSHEPKDIPYADAVEQAKINVEPGKIYSNAQYYFDDGEALVDSIKRRHYRPFIESLFSKRVYICEGANDELFINAALQKYGVYYDDYTVFKAWGKANTLVFANLFSALDIEVVVFFDVDNEEKPEHKTLNQALRAKDDQCVLIEFEPNLEVCIGYGEDRRDKNDAIKLMHYLDEYDFDNLACLDPLKELILTTDNKS